MIYPNVNLNGTSKQSLVDEYADVVAVAESMIARMYAAMPNARDYTPQGSPEALKNHRIAVEQMIARIQSVRAIISDMESLIEHVMR